MVSNDNWFGIEPPKDANGEVIPLDTEVLYTPDGKTLHVICIKYLTKSKRWETYGHFEGGFGFWEGCTDKLLLAPPDSWDKLEEDALLSVDEYRNLTGIDCNEGAYFAKQRDLIRRAKRLAGVNDD